MAGPDMLRPGSSWLTTSSLAGMFNLSGRFVIGRVWRLQPPFTPQCDQAIALALTALAIGHAKRIGAVMVIEHFRIRPIVRGNRHIIASIQQGQGGHVIDYRAPSVERRQN